MDQHLVKASFLRQVGLLVTEVPFAKNTGLVACLLQSLGKGNDIKGEALAIAHGVGDAHLKGVAAAHQGGTGGGAGRADVEVAEAGGLGVEAINMRGFQVRVAHAGEVTHALVIGEHKNDVGLGS